MKVKVRDLLQVVGELHGYDAQDCLLLRNDPEVLAYVLETELRVVGVMGVELTTLEGLGVVAADDAAEVVVSLAGFRPQ